MRIVRYRAIWFLLSGVCVAASLFMLFFYGLRLSADYTEGTLYELKFEDSTVTKDQLVQTLAGFDSDVIGAVSILETRGGTFVVRGKRLDSEQSTRFLDSIGDKLSSFEKIQERLVSPTVADTFKKKALYSIVFVSVMIVVYIAFAFRRVSRGISSWKLGMSAIVALLHDITITVGVFSLLGVVADVEVDLLFITALLTVMGFSVHDTIVVFDRIRENLVHKKREQSFSEIVDIALNQTMGRSINTSMTTIIVLVALLLFGSAEIYWFVFALGVGIIVGTYSSIFIASTLLVSWQRE